MEYSDADLETLAAGCATLGWELRQKKARSSEERSALAAKASALLLAASGRLAPKPYVPHEPERMASGGRIAEAYAEWYRSKAQALRYLVVQRASDFVLGAGARQWLGAPSTAPFERRRYFRATSSDAGLMDVLRELEAVTREAAQAVTPEMTSDVG